MMPMTDHVIVEYQLRVKRAELLGPHFAELALQNRRRRQRVAVRERIGRVLVATGTRLQGPLPRVPAATAG